MKKVILAAVLLGFILGMVTMGGIAAVMQSQWRMSSVAALKTVGVAVYEDADLTVPALSIDWGMLEPSESKDHVLYIVNLGNVPVVLSLTTDNWQPTTAASFITLTWAYNNAPVSPSSSVKVTLTLSVNPAISGISAFSFDIIIIGSG
jgi:hypothetical protein